MMFSKKISCIKVPKKILSINHPSQVNLRLLMQDLEYIDYFEFRLDNFSPFDHNAAIDLRQLKPWILKSLDRKIIYAHLIEKPSFIDLDFFSQLDLIKDFEKKFPIILSAHFCGSLEEVKNLYEKMLNYQVEIYKIVVTPKDQIECLKIAKFFRERKEKNFVRFCMGEDFSYTRYFALIDEHPFIYIGIEGQLTALGQISLREIKNYKKNYHTPKLLGLIGDPVTKSVSDIVYNFYFKQKNIEAIYLKIRVREEEFGSAIQLIKELGFSGLSVTTPLKLKAAVFHENNPLMPCNTVLLQETIIGLNTDNQALIYLLEKKIDLRNAKILVIGCGPLAISFIQVLLEKKALVYVKNRTKEKVELLKKKFPIFCFQEDQREFTAIIQATSKEFFYDQKQREEVLKAKVYFEAVNIPIFTEFTKQALEEGQFVFLGFELFLHQGFYQLKHFLKQEITDDFFSDTRGLIIKELQRKY